MKKTKYLALALSAAVMMMGAGYAAWTDTLNINHTVSTGNFDVDFVNANGATQVSFAADTYVTTEGGITALTGDDNEEASADQATITLGNMYPGAEATATVKLQNVGSIPALLDQIVMTTSSDPAMENAVLDNMIVTAKVNGQDVGQVQGGTLSLASNDYELAKDATATVVFTFTMDEDAPNVTTENKSVTYTITPSFKQVNL